MLSAFDLLPWGRGRRLGHGVNYVALLAVLAATSFALPLLVQGCEALGLQRAASVVVSLVLATGLLLLWLARAWRSARVRAGRPAARRTELRRAHASTTSSGRKAAPIAPASSAADGGSLRLRDVEEEQRARV